jgi:hypothetical protein
VETTIDIDFGTRYHLNQANPLLHEIYRGDSLWAFTAGEGARLSGAHTTRDANADIRHALNELHALTAAP